MEKFLVLVVTVVSAHRFKLIVDPTLPLLLHLHINIMLKVKGTVTKSFY